MTEYTKEEIRSMKMGSVALSALTIAIWGFLAYKYWSKSTTARVLIVISGIIFVPLNFYNVFSVGNLVDIRIKNEKESEERKALEKINDANREAQFNKMTKDYVDTLNKNDKRGKDR